MNAKDPTPSQELADAAVRGTGDGRTLVLENRDILHLAGGGASIALNSNERD